MSDSPNLIAGKQELVLSKLIKDNGVDNISEQHREECIFLLNYFLFVYFLEIVLQFIVLIYSFLSYTSGGESMLIVELDFFISILLLIEIRSHYLSNPKNFWESNLNIYDTLLCILSIGLIVLFFFNKGGFFELSKDVDLFLHLFREITRLLRLPLFINNFKLTLELFKNFESIEI